MSQLRVYINPKDDTGVFTGFQEVTEDVASESISNIVQIIDNDEYDVGLFNYNSFSLKFNNQDGKYSDVDNVNSIFRFRRGGSKIQFRWQVQVFDSICGIAECGKALISPEITVYDGILNDDATRLDIDDQQVTFRVLSSDSIFEETETNFSSLSAGDLFSDAIFTVMNQTKITDLMTISSGNITVGLDLMMDTVADFENTTVKEALDILLFGSNSVLFVRDNVVFVKPRDGGSVSQFTFRGQASNEGIEDIIDITDISAGRNNVFNFWTWRDTTLFASDSASITANGLRKKEIDFDPITTTGS